MDEIYNKIKALRSSKNISQTDMAQQLGMVQNNYSRLERGDISLTIERLREIAAILKEPIENFFLEQRSTTDSNMSVEETKKIIEMEVAIIEAIYKLKQNKVSEGILILRIVLGSIKDYNLSYKNISPSEIAEMFSNITVYNIYKLLSEEIELMDSTNPEVIELQVIPSAPKVIIYSKKELMNRIKNKIK